MGDTPPGVDYQCNEAAAEYKDRDVIDDTVPKQHE